MMQPSPSGMVIPLIVVPFERRDLARRAAVRRRIAAEFREMPGLVLSVRQASRLLGLDEAACERILATLASEGLLRRRTGGAYGT